MITHKVEHGSPEWHELRTGMPTASQFHKIVTPKKLSLSSQANGYMCELLASRFIDANVALAQDTSTQFMDRGTILESKARLWYELAYDITLSKNVFCTNDSGTIGCSPDALVGDDGGVEIKCRGAKAHVGWLLGYEQAELQCQGCMMITGRKWWDHLHYHPEMPPKLTRLERNDEVIERLGVTIEGFVLEMKDAEQRLIELGCEKRIADVA